MVKTNEGFEDLFKPGEREEIIKAIDSERPGKGQIRVLEIQAIQIFRISEAIVKLIQSSEESSRMMSRLQIAIVVLTIVIAASGFLTAIRTYHAPSNGRELNELNVEGGQIRVYHEKNSVGSRVLRVYSQHRLQDVTVVRNTKDGSADRVIFSGLPTELADSSLESGEMTPASEKQKADWNWEIYLIFESRRVK